MTFVDYSSASGNLLKQAYEDDAAYDLMATEDYTLKPLERRMFNTGIKVGLPSGIVGLVCSRSGLAFNSGVVVLNAPGVVDPGYRGDISVLLINLSDEPHDIEIGDKIGQLLFCPLSKVNFRLRDIIDNTTDRGTGGFGSSGK